MSLVASTIPNLVSGVSQQPAPSRLKTSGKEMINGFPSVVTGLIKRPPSEFISELAPSITVSDQAAVHVIDRDANEKYILVCGDGDLELYDQFGVQQTVTFPDGKSYLPTSDVWRKLKFVTVADTTFIANNEVTVSVNSISETENWTISPPYSSVGFFTTGRTDPESRASVFIKQAVASVAYAIYIDGVLAATTTTSSNTDAASALEGTTEIAEALVADAIANGYTGATNYGPTVSIPITAGQRLTVDDEFGGGAMTPYTNALQEFSELPPQEENGRIVRIEGNLDSGNSASYWVEFFDGVWRETVGYGSREEFDASTMPHILVKTGANTFEFRQNDWVERKAGDNLSNPAPSFVGSQINSLFLFKGRLGFLSEENVVLSTVTSFEELYRTTAVQLLASDVIDVASATGRVSTLYHAASFSDELILFSDKQQFRLSSGNVLSAESVGITRSTSYPCSTVVAPVVVGSSAYFVADGPTNTVAREVFIDGQRETVNGEDIAIQIPSYIPKNIRALTASTTSDVFLALSEDEPNAIYVYKWYTTERRKIQSAWCKWVFDENVSIVGMGFLDSYLYFVYKVGSDVRIDRINVAPIIDKDLLLDHQVDDTEFVSMTYDGGTDLTTVVMPYGTPSTLGFYRTDDQSFAPVDGLMRVDEITYTIPGDVTSQSFTAGLNYQFEYEFSTQYLREENSAGESPIQDGRLQLRYFSVIYTDTSYFEATVQPTNGALSTYVFNGRTLADPDNIADVIPKDTGEFRFPIMAQNEEVSIKLISNQPYQCAFGSVEWSANYHQKARRV